MGCKHKMRKNNAPDRPVSFQDICGDFGLLVGHIRNILPFVTIVISSIIPGLGDWELSKGWVIKTNDYMQV